MSHHKGLRLGYTLPHNAKQIPTVTSKKDYPARNTLLRVAKEIPAARQQAIYGNSAKYSEPENTHISLFPTLQYIDHKRYQLVPDLQALYNNQLLHHKLLCYQNPLLLFLRLPEPLSGI